MAAEHDRTGRVLFTGGGGGGVTSDELTAHSAQVLAGYTAVTNDSNDEAMAGTMPDRGNNQYGGWGSGTDYYAINTLPEGYYHKQSSSETWAPEARIAKSTVRSQLGISASKILSGQTIADIAGTATSDATATAAYIYTGKTAYVKGSKITGTMTVNSALSFKVAAVTDTTMTISWTNPSKGPFSGVKIRIATNGYPGTSGSATKSYTGYGSSIAAGATSYVVISGLTQNTYYYISCFSYVTASKTMYSSVKNLNARTNAKGQHIFATSGTFTVPSNVYKVDVFMVNGGNGGGQYYDDGENTYGGAGGGSGYVLTQKSISVTPGQSFAVVVGAGGPVYATKKAFTSGYGGGQSSFGNYKPAAQPIKTSRGGIGVFWGSNTQQCGGSGGGSAGYDSGSGFCCGGDGGSDGSNGYYAVDRRVDGAWESIQTLNQTGGSGSTTRAFGESWNTLYSGGGGGGASKRDNGGAGSGGSGGGGKGKDLNPAGSPVAGSAGTANTGGGGGGGAYVGGSGIVIVRWGY